MPETKFLPDVTPESIGWPSEPTIPGFVCTVPWCQHADCRPYEDVDGKWYSLKRLTIAEYPDAVQDLEIFRTDVLDGDTWIEGDLKFATATAEAMSAAGPEHFGRLLFSIFCAGRKVGGAQ